MIDKVPLADYQKSIHTWFYRQQKTLIQLGIVLGILAASFVAGLRAHILILVMVVGIIGLLFLIKTPALGLPIIIVSALIIPFSIGTGTGSSVNAPMLVIVALTGLWILEMYRQRSFLLVKNRVLLPLLGLCIATALAFVNGQIRWFDIAEAASISSQIGGIILFLLPVILFTWVGHNADLRWLKITTWLYLAFGAVHVFGRLIPGLSNYAYWYFQWGAISNSLFWIWTITLAFSQGLLNERLHWVWRGALLALSAAGFYLAFFQMGDWKSGWVPPLIAIAVIVAVRWPRLTVLMGILAASPAFSIFANALNSDLYSYSTRLDAWSILFKIIKVSPLLGLGPSNYYFYTPLFPIRGYYVNFNSHNQYVDLVAQVGIVGALFYIWFFVAVGLLAWRMLNKLPKGFASAYVVGGLAGTVAMVVAGLLGDWIIPFVYNVGFSGFRGSVLGWLFLGGILALWRLYTATDEGTESELPHG